jgi:hypothetical protein
LVAPCSHCSAIDAAARKAAQNRLLAQKHDARRAKASPRIDVASKKGEGFFAR